MVPARKNTKEINAADVEHLTALIAGGLLLVNGFRKKGLAGSISKLAGAALLFRGQQGYRRLYDLLGVPLAQCPTGVGRQNMRVETEVTVQRPRRELYRTWRNVSNLPVFMDHLLSVHEISDTRSLWVAKAPAGMVIKWEAEIINDIENELIAWHSLEGSGVDNAGSVHFSDDLRGGTRIRVVLRYDPPADLFGIFVAKLFRNDPQRQIEHDLKRFKAIMELGSEGEEVATEVVVTTKSVRTKSSRKVDDSSGAELH